MAQLKRDMDAFKKKAKAEQERAARMVGLATDSVSREINLIIKLSLALWNWLCMFTRSPCVFDSVES